MTVRLRQTCFLFILRYYFAITLLVGYGAFIFWLGTRPIVLLSGGTITGIAAVYAYCVSHLKATDSEIADHNLLHENVFFSRIEALIPPIVAAGQLPSYKAQWHQAQTKSRTIYNIATGIASQEPAFIPDLIETLHTVLELVDQLAQALTATHQVQTPHYQEIAQQQLNNSTARLDRTREQLQTLHDQVLVARLNPSAHRAPAAVSHRLQTLITDNKNGILKD